MPDSGARDHDFRVERVLNPENAPGLAGTTCLMLDPRVCIGDVQRDVAVALSDGRLDRATTYKLVVIAPADPSLMLNHARVLSRHLSIAAGVHPWLGEVPGATTGIAPGLETWRPPGQDPL